MNSSYRAEGGNPSGNGLLNGENSTGGPSSFVRFMFANPFIIQKATF